MTKEITTMYLDPAQLQELRVIAQHTKRPMAQFVREAIDQWLDRRHKGRRTTVKPYSPNGSSDTLDTESK